MTALMRASSQGDETCAAEGLCDHSARKMQRATAIYQEHGGRYEGPKRRDNSLSRWAEEAWQTSDGSPSRGRKNISQVFLPLNISPNLFI